MVQSDLQLRQFVEAIVSGDTTKASKLLTASPKLAKACFQRGATRANAKSYYLEPIARYIIGGDTALHLAAACYHTEVVRDLIEAGADIHARNRLGHQPIHAAAAGVPGSASWNPPAQAATVIALIKAGADPNTTDKRGVSPLHRAVRTRCAAAVRVLLEHGSNPAQRNKNGSDPMLLALQNTGRGGSGSPKAKSEQEEIIKLLRQSLSGASVSN
jgi:ankyrin repeat protein